SGNVVFDAAGTPEQWAKKLEAKLARESRLPIAVVCRTLQQFDVIRAGNAFLKERGIDTAHCYVTFLGESIDDAKREVLSKIEGGADRLTSAGDVIYLHCPGGYGRTKLSNNVIEKKLGIKATTRNWNTVNQLHAMMAAQTQQASAAV